MKATTTSTRFAVYAACLAAYNSGTLHGAWIEDLDQKDADEVQEEIGAMLDASPVPDAEEWAFHDYDGFHGIDLGENEDLDKLVELAAALAEHGEPFAAFRANMGSDDSASVEDFQEAYMGEYDSVEAYAEELVDEGQFGPIPEAIAGYIDCAAIARDLVMGGDIWTTAERGRCYVFRNI